MTGLAFALVGFPILLFAYAYAGYPLILVLIARLAPRRPAADRPGRIPLPSVSISLPVYNEEAQIRDVIESLLALEYPPELRQIVIVSDASTDATDAIASQYAERGVELVRLAQRAGKTTAENTAASALRGDIVVNTDASIRIRPDAVHRLLTHFSDPTVGVASGRDISIGGEAGDANIGEAGYVNYEMRIRALETRIEGIVGASGCFYAVRAHLHRQPLPDHLSRDFASVLIAREHGYRAVSVDDATCHVPRTASIRREYRRKVRTMSRGIETLAYKRRLLNPFRYGVFAWMLLSHKVCRWLVPLAALGGIAGLLILAFSEPWARLVAGGAVAVAGLAALGWRWPETRPVPRWLGVLTGAVVAQVATLVSLYRAFHGDQNAAWEPTRRDTPSSQQILA